MMVAPARERGLKCLECWGNPRCVVVAPARERGLKYYIAKELKNFLKSRSREGAWIEILMLNGNRCVLL